jgi:hypothetical protein
MELNSHAFFIDDAKKYGVNAAIVLYNFNFWIKENIIKKRNIHDNRAWTYNTVKRYKEQMPYLTEKQIRIAIDKLVEEGVLLKGNYNKHQYDRTCWYAFSDERERFNELNSDYFDYSICPQGQKVEPSGAKGIDHKGEPIPYSNPVSNPVNKPKRKRFKPPTPEEVENYQLEKHGSILFKGTKFCNYYESKGWLVGKNKMSSWKAAVRTWLENNYESNKQEQPQGIPVYGVRE